MCRSIIPLVTSVQRSDPLGGREGRAMASAMKDLSASRLSSMNELCSFVGATQVESMALLSKFNWNVAVGAFKHRYRSVVRIE